MCIKGFVPLDSLKDPIAEILSRHNVAGVVTRGSAIAGIDKRDFVKCKYGLVVVDFT